MQIALPILGIEMVDKLVAEVIQAGATDVELARASTMHWLAANNFWLISTNHLLDDQRDHWVVVEGRKQIKFS